jgi:hypothetical protein
MTVSGKATRRTRPEDNLIGHGFHHTVLQNVDLRLRGFFITPQGRHGTKSLNRVY